MTYCQKGTYLPEYSTILKVKKDSSNSLRQNSRIVPRGIESYFNLKKDVVKKMELNFNKIYELEAKNRSSEDNKIEDLSSFAYQYLGIVINGKKYIYINAFHASLEKDNSHSLIKNNWKRKLVNVYDGCNGFWGALYDIEEQKFSSLQFNGCA